MVFKNNHKCALGLGSQSMLPAANANCLSRTCRKLRKLFIVSERHPLAFEHLRSYPTLLAERKRHMLESSNVIHPLSTFSLVWKALMILINLSHMVTSTLRFCIITDPFNMLYIEKCDWILFFLQSICCCDMVICFNIGFWDKESAMIELNHRKIAKSYLCSYFFPDLMSSIPIYFIMLMDSNRSYTDLLIPDVLPFARCARIFNVLDDLKTTLRTVTTSHIWYRFVRQVILVILAVHCFTCLLYVPSCFAHYVFGKIPSGFTGFLDTVNLTRSFYNVTSTQRYAKGMFVAISAFFSTGFSMFLTYHESETVVNSLIMLFGTMFKMYTIVYWLKTYMTVHNSSLRYQELMDQVEKFMRYHQFPAPLMRRLRNYYRYRFQDNYYKESVALGYLSAQLQDEIRLHTCQSLVDKVPVLQDVPPAVLGRLLGCLEFDVYMPNDLVYHVGDVGTHMYFISTGSLSLYTVKGVEAMHFEDGDFVGGLALVTPHMRRATTLVAIEISLIHRISFENMREVAKLNPVVMDRIKVETFKRLRRLANIDGLVLSEGLPGLPDQPEED